MRYEEFKIELVNKENEVIGVDVHKDIPAEISIDLNEICAFRQAFGNGEEIGSATMIYLKNGEAFLLNISYGDFLVKFHNLDGPE